MLYLTRRLRDKLLIEVELEVRDCEDEVEGRTDGPKRIKMRDLESVLRVEGIRNCRLDSSRINKDEGLGNHKEAGHSEITSTSASTPSVKSASETTACKSFENVASCLTLAPASTTGELFSGHDVLTMSGNEITKQICPIETIKEGEQDSTNMVGLVMDLNSADTSSTAEEHNPFYPFKKLGQIKHGDASECGSTTGPVEETGPLRMWKQMKQNGFLSSSHGGVLIPKQRGRQPRKRKNDELKSKIEFAKKEQFNRFTKIAAPSGLLSGLNPGIINHVRNSKQVHSIIDAIVHSEKRDGRTQSRIDDQMGRVTKENSEKRKENIFTQGSSIKQMNLPASEQCIPLKMENTGDINEMDMLSHNFCQDAHATSQLTTESKDAALTLKLSSDMMMVAENASSATTDEFSANQGNINTLSWKAANVASQWLDLLQQDIKGRLAALKRSKKRVRNVIQTELPHLLSKEFPSNQENEHTQSSEMHVARWRSLFSQMDRELHEEGKHLESWLKQVQEMQLHCENGLKFVSSGGSSQLISAHDPSKSKKSDAVEREFAVHAAAASIYSTCNFIMATENVQCF
ncbi:hypothetical protein Cni_G04578 [Canna indica]|uniref:Uncharacterized protein n=1 Tax=Canna indica TaxID=4628 RepID=A0AAQ3JTN8_9LILI|nr:hypothetical protein Cni_G04578 [Canna indica]